MLRKLLLVGALQGWALWGIWKARELHIWPNTDISIERSLFYLCLALPLVIYLTEGLATLIRQRRLFVMGTITILFPLLGAYSGWADNISKDGLDLYRVTFVRPSDLIAATVLAFILIPLLIHFNSKSKSWTYHELFETAWRNVILCASAAFLTGIFWMVLFAGSALLRLIGLNFMQELIQKAIFSIPVTAVAFATAYALSLARAEMVITLRRFQLSLLAWLLPLLMMFIVVWVVALPFTGVDSLFKTHHAAYIMLWCVALCISFVNAAYQDGLTAPSYGKYLGKLLAWGWLSLTVVVAVAGWAMWLRIDQYGWSEDRVWGVFVMLMGLLYVLGYSASALRGKGWMVSIGKTNMWVAVVLCTGLVALLTPIADARRISVNNQMQRLTNLTTPSDQFDFDYLRWHAGKYGHDALLTIESGINHPDHQTLASKAKQLLAQKQRYPNQEIVNKLTPAELRQRIRMLPETALLNDALLKTMQAEPGDWWLQQCLKADTQCGIWLIDLNKDRALDAVVFIKNKWNNTATARVLQNTCGNYHAVGSLSLPASKTYDQLLTDIAEGKFKMVTPIWSDIELSDQHLHVIIDNKKNGLPP